MTSTVTIPLWLFVCILAFAVVTLASHFLFPSVRWFFRHRMERAVARLNERLERPIEPFKLARRHDMIQRLIYDTEVSQAISDFAREKHVPENVAFEWATRYAREIVPSFSATAYFSIAMRMTKWLSRSLYQVRVEHMDETGFHQIDPDAAVVYVMNHRSNMDYLLVTWLASDRTAMSYAVGEWARVWPLSWVIRAMGAYFIRRNYGNALYRRVLARYVQLAIDGGVTQAMFPEGGLSLTGALYPPKLGLLKYMVEEPGQRKRDVVFVPVAINYDRVFEDSALIKAAQTGKRRFPARIGVITSSALRIIWRKLIRQTQTRGYAAVSFGTPLSLAAFQNQTAGASVDALADELMARIGREMPVLPVALVSHVLAQIGSASEDALQDAIATTIDALPDAHVHKPDGRSELILERALDIMVRREMVQVMGGVVQVKNADLIAYYAASIQHLFANAA